MMRATIHRRRGAMRSRFNIVPAISTTDQRSAKLMGPRMGKGYRSSRMSERFPASFPPLEGCSQNSKRLHMQRSSRHFSTLRSQSPAKRCQISGRSRCSSAALLCLSGAVRLAAGATPIKGSTIRSYHTHGLVKLCPYRTTNFWGFQFHSRPGICLTRQGDVA
jgi:hypothetical protein